MSDNEGCLGTFTAVTGVLGFVVDIIALISIFGIDLIVQPTMRGSASHPALILKLPVDAEVITFIIWVYALVAGIAMPMLWTDRFDVDWGCVTGPSYGFYCAIVPPLLAVWLWGFGYIPSWLYVFLVAALGFLGMNWFALIITVSTEEGWGCLAPLIALGPALLWLYAGYDIAFIWVILIAFLAWLVGGGWLLFVILRD